MRAAAPVRPDPSDPSPIPVVVYYDFASTIAYVAHRVMGRMRDDLSALGLELRWIPIDLSVLNRWPRDAEIDEARRQNALRVARELDVALRMPRHWIDSRPLHAIALEIGSPEREAAWRERVWSAIFEQGRGVGGAEEARRLAAELVSEGSSEGSSEMDVEAACDTGAQRLARNTRRAHSEMVNGVPTFMLGGWPFAGIQQESTMRSLLGRFAEKQRRADPASEREASP